MLVEVAEGHDVPCKILLMLQCAHATMWNVIFWFDVTPVTTADALFWFDATTATCANDTLCFILL